ncbi:hypothetical protein [Streptomyces viridochromogenes]|nr:hypothetical protein [Streptomyces viridochromogenes]
MSTCWKTAVVHALVDVVMDWAAGLPHTTRDALMAPYRQLLWRYITSIALPNAQRLLSHADSGLLRLAAYDPRSVHATQRGFEVSGTRYDHVVAAAGYTMPALFRSRRTLHLGSCPADAAAMASLGPDLRVGPPGVWTTGATPSVRIPFANFLVSAVRQASDVARQLALPDQRGGEVEHGS